MSVAVPRTLERRSHLGCRALDGTRSRRVLAGARTSRLPSDSPLFLRCPIFDPPDSSRDSVPSRPPSPALLAPLLRAPFPATGAFRRRPSKRSCASTSRRCAPATKRSCAAIPSFKASRHFFACGALGGEAAGHAVNAAVSRPPECAVAFVASQLDSGVFRSHPPGRRSRRLARRRSHIAARVHMTESVTP